MTVLAHAALKPLALHALQMLREAGSRGLTTNEARALGCGDRFAARVLELRQAFGPESITDRWETHGEARFKRYFWADALNPQASLDL